MINIILVAITAFVIGFEVGRFLKTNVHRRAEEPPRVSPTESEIEKALREREEFIESQKAFQRMMGYNADIAYGIADDDIAAGGS